MSASYLKKPRNYTYDGITVCVEPGIFPPFITLSTKILLDFLRNKDLENRRILELGCGSGIISIFAATKGALVTSTDINDVALKALAENARKNSVSIEVLKSDLFDNLHGRDFDLIVINPPYYAKEPANVEQQAWFCGKDFGYFRKLFKQLPSDCEVVMILSEDCDLATITAIAQENGRKLATIFEKKVAGERNYIFAVT